MSDCLFFYSHSYFLFSKDFENGNATYTCYVSNTRGRNKCSMTEKMLKYRPEKDFEMPSLPILVGIALIGMLVLVCIGFVLFFVQYPLLAGKKGIYVIQTTDGGTVTPPVLRF